MTYHPQINDQSKRVIQVLEDMLQCCVLEFVGSFERYLPLVDFAYNNITEKVSESHHLKHCMEGDVEYELGKLVFFKLSPWKNVLRFGCKEKLSPGFIGPYEVLERVGPAAYRLKLPRELDRIHDVFHGFMLRKYCANPSHVKVLQNKKISLVKVLWPNHKTSEATWETEEAMKKWYSKLFEREYFEDEMSFVGESYNI
ncbi:pol protein [Gossypium australe]|uniref:Pol protein n=1 Tax=Gossypium australe TaxID=47621 RepID=A0A5B6UW74_9ROSI|nr:pol protein [Gossypium australe]